MQSLSPGHEIKALCSIYYKGVKLLKEHKNSIICDYIIHHLTGKTSNAAPGWEELVGVLGDNFLHENKSLWGTTCWVKHKAFEITLISFLIMSLQRHSYFVTVLCQLSLHYPSLTPLHCSLTTPRPHHGSWISLSEAKGLVPICGISCLSIEFFQWDNHNGCHAL